MVSDFIWRKLFHWLKGPRALRGADDLPLETLERRDLLAASIGFDAVTGVITIQGSGGDDQAYVRDLGALIEVELVNVVSQTFDKSTVNSVTFTGANGNDEFHNLTDIVSTAYGQSGNDLIHGGSSDDVIDGGPGQDVLYGNAGNDTISGGYQYDLIYGGGGDDALYGGRQNDFLRGGAGNDFLGGGFGDDRLYGDGHDDRLYGFSGNDVLDGGHGDDQLYGQHGQDELHGSTGSDGLRGGPGDDELHGGDGSDVLLGNQDNDTLFGNHGIDWLGGHDGDDVLWGGDANDFLRGHHGQDTLNGEAGDDFADGGHGDDQILGGTGDDQLFGGAGNDWLRGQAGADSMNGGDGDDALYGGAASESDSLTGGGDDDRLLARSDDHLVDVSANDAVLMFVDRTSVWTDAEIEVMDRGLKRLHDRTQNTSLLRDPLTTDPLTFYKYDDLGGSSGLNRLQWSSETSCDQNGCTTTYVYHREIHIADWDETSDFYNDFYASVVIHEIGHNWDSELELTSADAALADRWNQFLAISDWRDTYPGSGYTLSLDGQWWYRNDANFADNYGRSNPNEDLSTSWEYYFDDYQNPNLDHSDLQSKMDLLDAIFDVLT